MPLSQPGCGGEEYAVSVNILDHPAIRAGHALDGSQNATRQGKNFIIEGTTEIAYIMKKIINISFFVQFSKIKLKLFALKKIL